MKTAGAPAEAVALETATSIVAEILTEQDRAMCALETTRCALLSPEDKPTCPVTTDAVGLMDDLRHIHENAIQIAAKSEVIRDML